MKSKPTIAELETLVQKNTEALTNAKTKWICREAAVEKATQELERAQHELATARTDANPTAVDMLWAAGQVVLGVGLAALSGKAAK